MTATGQPPSGLWPRKDGQAPTAVAPANTAPRLPRVEADACAPASAPRRRRSQRPIHRSVAPHRSPRADWPHRAGRSGPIAAAPRGVDRAASRVATPARRSRTPAPPRPEPAPAAPHPPARTKAAPTPAHHPRPPCPTPPHSPVQPTRTTHAHRPAVRARRPHRPRRRCLCWRSASAREARKESMIGT